MIHLPPMPGYPQHPGLGKVIRKALIDLKSLEDAGFDGVLVENDSDQPHQIVVSQGVRVAFSKIMTVLLNNSSIPVGMEIVYDMRATVEIAHKVGAQFVRLDVFVDSIETEWGKIFAQAHELMNLKKKIGADSLLIFADIQVKHARMLEEKSLRQSASQAIKHGADALIVTGNWTGLPPKTQDSMLAKGAANGVPVLIGSGLDSKNIKKLFQYADGGIVGTSIKAGEYVDFKKAKNLKTIASRLTPI